ncbi:MAG: hypothetical protein EBU37_07190 [Actinobacteria bacterium]|nr:hypothetical protein [Actinomycetota bacterium]
MSMCITGNGTRAGLNARTAKCNMTTESLPPENNITGRSNSAATSRMIVTDSSIRLRNADFTLLRLGLWR